MQPFGHQGVSGRVIGRPGRTLVTMRYTAAPHANKNPTYDDTNSYNPPGHRAGVNEMSFDGLPPLGDSPPFSNFRLGPRDQGRRDQGPERAHFSGTFLQFEKCQKCITVVNN